MLNNKFSLETKIDYTRLEDLLAARKLEEADKETRLIMLKVSAREKEGWLDAESIKNFPCRHLQIIDQLWLKYSAGRFGFSVQRLIWDSVGGCRADGNNETFFKFLDYVGWNEKGFRKKYSELTFDLNSPQGHLPSLIYRYEVIGDGGLTDYATLRRGLESLLSLQDF